MKPPPYQIPDRHLVLMRTYWHIAKVNCNRIGCARYCSVPIHRTSFKGGPSWKWPHCRGCPARRIDLLSLLRTSCSWSIAISHRIRATDILTRKDCPRRLEMRGNCRHDINVDSNSDSFIQAIHSFIRSYIHSLWSCESLCCFLSFVSGNPIRNRYTFFY
jgi:hypothetical protein